jgi:serine protease Do
MGTPYGWPAIGALIANGLLALTLLVSPAYPSDLSSNVRLVVTRSNGDVIGSGSYLGNGTFLTANHVVPSDDPIAVFTSSGDFFAVKVIARDEKLDIAILHTPTPGHVTPVAVDCRFPKLGEELQFTGQPKGFSFLTVWSRVAKETGPSDTWPSVMTMDGFSYEGMSGAAGIAKDGRLAAVMVGNTTVYLAHGMNKAPLPLGWAVPSAAFCPLLKEAGVF